jgi:hypothetical protein
MTTLAPYTNAMRLGQGFNSYTQQICLDKAVVVPQLPHRSSSGGVGTVITDLTPSTGSDVSVGTDDSDFGVGDGPSRRIIRRTVDGQSQIVTYTAKFVDKLSDITGLLLRKILLCS